MSVHKRKDVTKDGRSWVFQISYTTYDGKKRYTSKKYIWINSKHVRTKWKCAQMVWISWG